MSEGYTKQIVESKNTQKARITIMINGSTYHIWLLVELNTFKTALLLNVDARYCQTLTSETADYDRLTTPTTLLSDYVL